MEYKGQFNGADIYDDYAHHPTEVRASLGAFRGFGEGRLICFFQSHTYSRTHALLDDFADALRLADLAVIAPIYSAREINESGVSQYTLAERIGKDAIACESFEECISTLRKIAKAGDTIVLMGAGDLPKILKDLEIE
jgi:UDP-N-acetylmuramate--alanine ligase